VTPLWLRTPMQILRFWLMIVLVVLFGSWLILRGIGALGVTALATSHDSVRYALAVMFVFTGVAHFNNMRRDLAQMIPSCLSA
jgi:hypothetical protein